MIVDDEAHLLLGDLDLACKPRSGPLLLDQRLPEVLGCTETSLFAHRVKITTDVSIAQYPVANMATSSFADWFKEKLGRKGWTPADFHAASGTPRATVGAWFRGERDPDPKSVRMIAETLDADVLSAYRVLGWYESPTADTPLQADLIATIRRRNIEDKTVQTLLAVIDQLEPKGK